MKKNIVISPGHYKGATNANINKKYDLIEYDEAEKVVEKMMYNKFLNYVDFQFLKIKNEGLEKKINFVNKVNPFMALEIHFNSNFGDRPGNGIEVLAYSGKTSKMAKNLLFGIGDFLPFKIRGIHYGKNIVKFRGFMPIWLKKTICPAFIIEILFLNNDNEAFFLKYPRSHEIIANSIIHGIDNIFKND